MNHSMNISLPAHMKKWVKEQAARKGFRTTDAFLLDVLRKEKDLEVRERVDDLLSEAISTCKPTPLTRQDWEDIRSSADAHERIEQMLVDGINSGESRPVTPATWERIRAKGRKMAKERRRK